MKVEKQSLRFAGLLALMLLAFSACKMIPHEMTVTMTNGSSTEVHLWMDGESIDPTNKLLPGTSRSVTYQIELDEEKSLVNFHVYAGKNGQTLMSKEFETVGAGPVEVRYTGAGLVME